MYPKVLVPLDGSKIAECALTETQKLSGGGLIGKIVLLSVIDIPTSYLADGFDYQEILQSKSDQLRKYLEGIHSRVNLKGVEVVTELLEGHAADVIINYAEKNAIDLIVMATHGYSGMKKLMFGSVALQVLHDAHVPVLLIRPKSSD